MSLTSNASDLFLTPLDPLRGLNALSEHLNRYAALDPKLHEAARLLQQRFDRLTDEEKDTWSAVLWAYVRGRLTRSTGVGPIMAWSCDGDRVLRVAETALRTVFADDSLKAVVRHANELTAAESVSPAAMELQRARDEVRSATGPELILPAVAFLAGVGIATIYMLEVEGYTVVPPPPPPPPPPDDRD